VRLAKRHNFCTQIASAITRLAAVGFRRVQLTSLANEVNAAESVPLSRDPLLVTVCVSWHRVSRRIDLFRFVSGAMSHELPHGPATYIKPPQRASKQNRPNRAC